MVERRKSLVVRTVGGAVVVYFTDSKIIDDMQIKCVGDELCTLVDQRHRSHIVINFQNVQRFSTALLGKLIGLKKKTVQAAGNVRLCCIPEHIMEVFRVTGLDAAFEIFPDEMAALRNFGPAGG